MSAQPVALRLAAALDGYVMIGMDGNKAGAAAELRRLHEVNAELLDALKLAKQIIGHPDDEASKIIEAAIAKAEPNQKEVK